MSFQNRKRFHDDNRLPFQNNRIPHQHNRLQFQDNKNSLTIPDNAKWQNSNKDRSSFQDHNSLYLQGNNMMPVPVSCMLPPPPPPPDDENRYGFPDQKPSLVDNPLPFEGNRLPYQDNKNSLTISDNVKWQNSNKNRSSFHDNSSTLQGNNMVPVPVSCMLPTHPPPPPSDEKPNYYDNKRQNFQDNRLHPSRDNNTSFQKNFRMPYPGNIRLPFEGNNNFPFERDVLPSQGNQKFPHQSIEVKGRLPFGGNSNQMFEDGIKFPTLPLPMNERSIPPKQILNSDSNTVINKDSFHPPFPNFQPIPRLPVGISNFAATPIQGNAENQPMNPSRLRPPVHNLMVSKPGNIPVDPRRPNLNVRIPPPTKQILQRFEIPAQNQMQKNKENHISQNVDVPPPIPNQVIPIIRFPAPNLNNSGPSQIDLPMNVKHRFPPPQFVPGQEMNMANNPILTSQLFCPPLTIPSNPDFVAKDLKAEYKETMVDIVKKWSKSRNSFATLKIKDNQFIKIHKFKENLKVFVGLIEKLRHLNDSLAEHMEAEKSVWDNLIEDVTKTKNEVVCLQYKLFNPEQMKFITCEQKNRKKKRDRIRRKKKAQSEEYVSSLSKRIKLNEEIDEAQQKQHTKIAMEKMVESLKNEAGESLVVVKRKQTEINEYINIFSLLKQLRDIRKETAIYQGIFVTEKDDEKFSTVIERVSKQLSCQAKVYDDEERALRVLREEEAEEMNRLENEKRKKRKQNRQEQLSTVDPMFPFRLYWLQGEESIPGLIHVRRMWDIFLCQPDTHVGTRIPKSFVEPCKPCNKEWGKFLVKQPKPRKRKSDFGTSTKS